MCVRCESVCASAGAAAVVGAQRAQHAPQHTHPPNTHTPPPQELSRRITLAMREAHGKSVTGMREKMKGLAASLGLPNPNALGGGPQ